MSYAGKVIAVDTTEGYMELNFRTDELYVQRGDLCWLMTKVEGGWRATCPMTDRHVFVYLQEGVWSLYAGVKIGEAKDYD